MRTQWRSAYAHTQYHRQRNIFSLLGLAQEATNMFELNSKMRFETKARGQGIFIRSAIKMFSCGINKTTVLECPLSFGYVPS